MNNPTDDAATEPTWNTATGPAVTHRWPGPFGGGFVCVATPFQYRMEFAVYKVLWEEAGKPVFNKTGLGGPNPTQDIGLAEVYYSGSVKWDGCANVQFDGTDAIMLHFCGRDGIEETAKMMLSVYDLAAEMIPTWDG